MGGGIRIVASLCLLVGGLVRGESGTLLFLNISGIVSCFFLGSFGRVWGSGMGVVVCMVPVGGGGLAVSGISFLFSVCSFSGLGWVGSLP